MPRYEIHYCQRLESRKTRNHESAIRHGRPRMGVSTHGKEEVRAGNEIPRII